MSVTVISQKTALCHLGCGAAITYKTNSKVVCESCRAEWKRAKDRRAADVQRRKRGVAAIKETYIDCQKCGTKVLRNGVKRKYCADCSDRVTLERAREIAHQKRQTPEGRNYNNLLAAKRRKTPKWSVSAHMSTLIHRALGKNKAGRSWRQFVPYTLDDLVVHLDRQFLPGMSWQNRGEWHIDHIQPLASFYFVTAEDPEFKAAWALSNLRPWWAMDNLKKSAKRLYLV